MLQETVIFTIGTQQALAMIPQIRFKIPSTSSQRCMSMLTEHTSTHRDGEQLDTMNGRSQTQRSTIARTVLQRPTKRNKRPTGSSLMTWASHRSFVVMTSLFFLANIDTPGEQQKYMVALLAYLFSLLPPQTTVVCLYDVGCVLDRSLHLVSLLRHPFETTDDLIIILLV